jgi:DNA-binding response OmpR family regulator
VPPRARILLVEDEENCVRALQYFLSQSGYEVVAAPRAREAIELAAGFRPDILLTDLFLADKEGGAEVARILLEEDPNLPVIVISGLPEPEIHRRIADLPVFRVCTKPLRLSAVAALVEAALATTANGGGGEPAPA